MISWLSRYFTLFRPLLMAPLMKILGMESLCTFRGRVRGQGSYSFYKLDVVKRFEYTRWRTKCYSNTHPYHIEWLYNFSQDWIKVSEVSRVNFQAYFPSAQLIKKYKVVPIWEKKALGFFSQLPFKLLTVTLWHYFKAVKARSEIRVEYPVKIVWLIFITPVRD